MVVNISGSNVIISLKNIVSTDIGSGQGVEIILQETGINPVDILVMPYSIRNFRPNGHERFSCDVA